MKMSHIAKQLLQASRESTDGLIVSAPAFGKLVRITIGGKKFPETHDPRSEALYKVALEELECYGLIEDRTGKGQVFHVTAYGYVFDETEEESRRRPIGFRTPEAVQDADVQADDGGATGIRG